jgi:hypothetical protein
MATVANKSVMARAAGDGKEVRLCGFIVDGFIFPDLFLEALEDDE